MKCEYGYCLVCEKEIAKQCSSCDSKRTTQDYTEVMLNWSNGSRMSTAVCIDCAKDRVWKADKQAMTEAIWSAWAKLGHRYDKGVVLVD